MEAAPPEWVGLTDEQLLKLRIRDLRLSVKRSPEVSSRVARLYGELEALGLGIRPKVYFGDEWFSPEGMLAIAVPFYLAHPRLAAIERRTMLEVEGGDPAYFMKLLRHEAGHCFDHAYRFSRLPRWRELFGPPGRKYDPDTYRPQPHSRSHVRNLAHGYAQAHPDEDFAETFAVLLDPRSGWKRRYAAWPAALRKLRFAEQLVSRSASLPVRAEGGYLPCSAARLGVTLGRYYARRRRAQALSLSLSAGRFPRNV